MYLSILIRPLCVHPEGPFFDLIQMKPVAPKCLDKGLRLRYYLVSFMSIQRGIFYLSKRVY